MNVRFDPRHGIEINDFFQTTNSNVYACGDCVAGSHKFTHSADFQARLAIRNMFLNDKNKYSDLLIPWCTYTIPEVAHVGKYEYELQQSHIEYESFTRQLAPVDRCRCDGVEDGFVKIIILKGTQDIIGCTIVGPSAGDMISEVTVCMQYGIGIAQLAGVIHPYPTTQEAIRQCALQYYQYYKDPNGAALKSLKKYMEIAVSERENEEEEV
jgi:pyruvate/2-oxoglutarate dehydrogenase complex dihydrolipoamide dehydrogenase (E3) component